MNMHTGEFKSFDNKPLFYRKWENKDKWNKKILVFLHRGHEHSLRLNEIANDKRFCEYKIFSYDNRGHGYSKTDATYEFMNLVRDLNSFISFICREENIKHKDIFIVANSVSALVTATWLHDYAPKIAGCSLVAPAFKIKLYAPFAKTLLNIAVKFKPDLNVKSYVKPRFLTHDIIEQKKYKKDKLINKNIPAKQLLTLIDTSKRIVKDASLISTPILILSANNDYIVDNSIQGDFFSKLSSKIKKFVKLEDFYHGVLYEENKDLALKEITSFINICFKNKEEMSFSKKIKITEDEKSKISFGSLSMYKKLSYFLQKQSINKLGFLSDGIKIGKKYGFDSGVTLDYIYENQASGKFKIGKMIDKNYLNSVGWKGIRQRKVHMIESITQKIKILRKENKRVKILDIAGGPARYLIELAKQYPDIEVLVQDYQIQNINKGKQLAKEYELSNIRYKQADAFDRENYKKESYSPNIVIVSGVFELFSQNELVCKAINNINSVIQDNGYIIYTGQPWHPQLEQIANVLGNHQKDKWIMRRRSQYELDYLFDSYGFEKEDMKIDNWGIFTVSSAKIDKSRDCGFYY